MVARPIKLADRRRVFRNGAAVDEGLLLWDDDEGRQPTWEPMEVIERRFPSLLLKDKVASNEGRVDTSSYPDPQESNNSNVGEPEIVFDASGKDEIVHDEEGRSGREKRRTREPKKFEDFISYRKKK